jgi:hypothetical protein
MYSLHLIEKFEIVSFSFSLSSFTYPRIVIAHCIKKLRMLVQFTLLFLHSNIGIVVMYFIGAVEIVCSVCFSFPSFTYCVGFVYFMKQIENVSLVLFSFLLFFCIPVLG